MNRHLKIAQRAGVSLRIAYLEELSRTPEVDQLEGFTNLESEVSSATEMDRPGRHWDTRCGFDGNVSRSLESLNTVLKFRVDTAAVFDPLLTNLAERMTRMGCTNCPTAQEHKCDGTNKDHTSAAKGACLSPLRVVYELINQETRRAYEEVNASPLPTMHTYFWTDDRESLERTPYSDCRFEDTSGLRESTITLYFSRAFQTSATRHDYMAIPYLLAHELVVHAYAALRCVTPRLAATPDDGFYEGWMDYVAVLFLRTIDTSGQFIRELAGGMLSDCNSRAMILSESRATSQTSGNHWSTYTEQCRRARLRGREAARTLHMHIERRHRENACGLLIDISLFWNLMGYRAREDRVPAQMEPVISLCRKLPVCCSDSEIGDALTAVYAAIDRAIETRDFDAFHKELTEINSIV